nr:hypothetical protein [Aquicoccus porphyridii]
MVGLFGRIVSPEHRVAMRKAGELRDDVPVLMGRIKRVLVSK